MSAKLSSKSKLNNSMNEARASSEDKKKMVSRREHSSNAMLLQK